MRKVHKLKTILGINTPAQTFLVLCGYSWIRPVFLSDDNKKVTCKRCLKIMEGKDG